MNIPLKAPELRRKTNNNSRTCCNLCHIKLGAAFLGLIEAIVAVSVLIGALQQVGWKNEQSHATCNESSTMFRDCHLLLFKHLHVTVYFDYVVIVMMILILASIVCLLCGVASDTSCLILPHIVIQAIFLLFSLGYFLLYAWSYFYGDLYTHKRPFMVQSLFERMWLATLLLILAGIQSYLFSSVVRCSMYLAGIEQNRRRRESAFERCSERVRIAKENGLWRTTSWGGGFQQYKGQYDKPKKEAKNKGFHVQWNPDVEADSQTTKTTSQDKGITVQTICKNEQSMPRSNSSHKKPTKLENRRSSTTSTNSIKGERRPSSESPRKDRLSKKTDQIGRNINKTDDKANELQSQQHVKDVQHRRQKFDRNASESSAITTKRHVTLRSSESAREANKVKLHKAPLNKSVDNDANYDEVVEFYKERNYRRRSSDHGRSKSSRSPDKKDVPIVKKVSISASASPSSSDPINPHIN